MSDPSETPTPSTTTQRRRSSFGGQNIAEIFEAARTRQASMSDNNTQVGPSPQFAGSISSVAFQAHRRRLSLSTLGLTGTSPITQPTPYAGFGPHRDSTSSANSGSIDESAVEDDGPSFSTSGLPQQSTSPFARRMSFGARALMDVKTAPAGAVRPINGTRPSVSPSPSQQHHAFSPPPDGVPRAFGGRGDSFGWVDSFRNRGDRSASINLPRESPPAAFQARARSIPTGQQTPPLANVPKRAVPDAYSERILRGEVDF